MPSSPSLPQPRYYVSRPKRAATNEKTASHKASHRLPDRGPDADYDEAPGTPTLSLLFLLHGRRTWLQHDKTSHSVNIRTPQTPRCAIALAEEKEES